MEHINLYIYIYINVFFLRWKRSACLERASPRDQQLHPSFIDSTNVSIRLCFHNWAVASSQGESRWCTCGLEEPPRQESIVKAKTLDTQQNPKPKKHTIMAFGRHSKLYMVSKQVAVFPQNLQFSQTNLECPWFWGKNTYWIWRQHSKTTWRLFLLEDAWEETHCFIQRGHT